METKDENIKNDIDFYGDAHEFFKSQLPVDFQQNLQNFIKDKCYNENEQRLFGFMLEKVITFHTTVVFLKSNMQ